MLENPLLLLEGDGAAGPGGPKGPPPAVLTPEGAALLSRVCAEHNESAFRVWNNDGSPSTRRAVENQLAIELSRSAPSRGESGSEEVAFPRDDLVRALNTAALDMSREKASSSALHPEAGGFADRKSAGHPPPALAAHLQAADPGRAAPAALKEIRDLVKGLGRHGVPREGLLDAMQSLADAEARIGSEDFPATCAQAKANLWRKLDDVAPTQFFTPESYASSFKMFAELGGQAGTAKPLTDQQALAVVEFNSEVHKHFLDSLIGGRKTESPAVRQFSAAMAKDTARVSHDINQFNARGAEWQTPYLKQVHALCKEEGLSIEAWGRLSSDQRNAKLDQAMLAMLSGAAS